MPRKLKLSWNKSLKQWYKTENGQRLWLGTGKGKSDVESYRKALAKLAENQKKPTTTKVEPKSTIVEQYIKYSNQRAQKSKAISVVTSRNVAWQSNKLLEFNCQMTPLGMRDIRDILLSKIRNEELKPTTARLLFAQYKTMYRWAYDARLVDNMPRDFRSAKLRLNREESEFHSQIFTYSTDNLRDIWQAIQAPDLKLMMLLGLNCGYTQKDIATLEAKHIINGRIKRGRHKTRVPTNFQLWTITASLFPPNFEETEGPLILASTGKSLLEEYDSRRCDKVWPRWERVTKKLGVPTAFKILRKTGAQLLGNIQCPLEVIQQYLGHTQMTIASAHYYNQDLGTTLDPWLRKLEIVVCHHIGVAIRKTRDENAWLKDILSGQPKPIIN